MNYLNFLIVFSIVLVSCVSPRPVNKRRSVSSKSSVLPWPVYGRVSSHFGMRRGRPHEGIDIAVKRGTPIKTVRSGRIDFAGWKNGYGYTVVVNHGNFKTLYAHCSKILVRKGQIVKTNQRIAKVGRTGNARGSHLHFEYQTMAGTPLNPYPYLLKNYKGKTSLANN